MAKGDEKRARNQMNFEGDRQYNQLENTRTGIIDPMYHNFQSNYQNAVGKQGADYDYGMSHLRNSVIPGYQQFSETGGYGPQDLASIRARALSPTRAVYANALRNVNRQGALQGGYSPGKSTLMARMAREQSQGLSDAATNAEGMIAQMVQQGKLAGLQGQNQASQNLTNLYGATPGQTQMFGNQVLGASGQYLDLMDAYNTRLGHQYNTMGNIMQDPGTAGRRIGYASDIMNAAGNAAKGASGIF